MMNVFVGAVLIAVSLTGCARPRSVTHTDDLSSHHSLAEPPRAVVWPGDASADAVGVPANVAWLVLSFNVPVAREGVMALELTDDAGGAITPKWVLTADAAYVQGATLWGPFSDERCRVDEVGALCAGHRYTLGSPSGLSSETGVAASTVATLLATDALLDGPVWLTPGGVEVDDRTVVLSRQPSHDCVVRDAAVQQTVGDPQYVVSLATGEAQVTGLAANTEYEWRLVCVDAAGRGTPPWPVRFRTLRASAVVIDEVVTEPRHDWNDSEALPGAPVGVPFDALATPSDKASATDEWVELLNAGDVEVDLSMYAIHYIDGTPSKVAVAELVAKGQAAFPRAGEALLLPGERAVLRLSAAGASASNSGEAVLLDGFGLARDRVLLGAGEVPDGNSSGLDDEAVARCVDAETGLNRWQRTRATPGSVNACH